MTYLISDIHGCYEAFQKLLKTISFGENDVLYILGDLVDCGEDPMPLLCDVSMRYNVYAIAGEHDFRAAKMLHGYEKMLKSGASPDADFVTEMTDWVKNGGQTTLEGYRALNDEMKEGVLDYLDDLPLYETASVNGRDYLLVHAGIRNYKPGFDLDALDPEDFFTEPADLGKVYDKSQTLVCGHRPTGGKIARGKNVIAIDCGAAFGGSLGCLRLEDGKEFYI